MRWGLAEWGVDKVEREGRQIGPRKRVGLATALPININPLGLIHLHWSALGAYPGEGNKCSPKEISRC